MSDFSLRNDSTVIVVSPDASRTSRFVAATGENQFNEAEPSEIVPRGATTVCKSQFFSDVPAMIAGAKYTPTISRHSTTKNMLRKACDFFLRRPDERRLVDRFEST